MRHCFHWNSRLAAWDFSPSTFRVVCTLFRCIPFYFFCDACGRFIGRLLSDLLCEAELLSPTIEEEDALKDFVNPPVTPSDEQLVDVSASISRNSKEEKGAASGT
eukprot:Lithocolla_globosa_v1_NODE_139_length_5801_cov_6.461364.p7 type:complete len:105 gc:universal NODE_139_length_5801_cov_6.461364:3967-4281(+)